MREVIKDMVNEYILDEMCYDSVKTDKDTYNYLNKLTDEEINEIVYKVINDDSIEDTIRNCINYYLYHTKKYVEIIEKRDK